MNSRPKWSDAKCVQYELTIDIEASAERVWRGLSDQLSLWWLPDFHMLGEDSLVELEPYAGGRLIEKHEHRELLWYTVIAMDRGHSLDMVGSLTSQFGGPATTMLNLVIEPNAAGTSTLRVSDSLFGHVTEGLFASLHSGWTALFHDGLKKFLETQA